MTTNVVSCRKDTDLATAARLMLDKRFGTLPVVDEHAGILSIDDIVLRGLDGTGDLPTTVFVEALRRLCSRPPVEPEINFTETFVSG